jgi:hypothetical protein
MGFSYIPMYNDTRKIPLLYDLDTTSILSKHIANDLTESSTVTFSNQNKQYTLNLNTRKHFLLQDPKVSADVMWAKRLRRWYLSNENGTWCPYDYATQAEIWVGLIERQHKITVTIPSGSRAKTSVSIDLARRIDINHKTGVKSDIKLEDEIDVMKRWDVHVPFLDISRVLLDDLPTTNDEFIKVSNFFHITMPKRCKKNQPINSIKHIWKIINPKLRKSWLRELKEVKSDNDNNPNLEYVRLLFHGTSSTHPKRIYNDSKGWKLNYANNNNLWGRGLYFAEDAIYASGKYAYPTENKTHLLLLAEVIVGDAIHSIENKELREPPFKNGSESLRYDSIIGNRHGTWIYVTYASGRAYPTYMIEYDPKA